LLYLAFLGELEKISILGCGWLGKAFALRLLEAGYPVAGSTTSRDKLDELKSVGIDSHLVDLASDITSVAFFEASIFIVAIPPRLKLIGEEKYLEFMSRAARFCRANSRRVIFISSTSVYPDVNREVFETDADETSVLVRAEKIFQAEKSFRTSIVRFAGLVGPGRHPGRFLSGKNVSGGSSPVNVIHLDDCLEILMKLLKDDRELVLNACADGHPTKKEFYSRASSMLNVHPPVFVDDESGWKIVSNALLKKCLTLKFRYPNPMEMTF
jgi:nucleoside-diphosphate-sugar epimerase